MRAGLGGGGRQEQGRALHLADLHHGSIRKGAFSNHSHGHDGAQSRRAPLALGSVAGAIASRVKHGPSAKADRIGHHHNNSGSNSHDEQASSSMKVGLCVARVLQGHFTRI